MRVHAFDVLFIALFFVPVVIAFIWGLFLLVPIVIDGVAETIADIKKAVKKLKKAWRGNDDRT